MANRSQSTALAISAVLLIALVVGMLFYAPTVAGGGPPGEQASNPSPCSSGTVVNSVNETAAGSLSLGCVSAGGGVSSINGTTGAIGVHSSDKSLTITVGSLINFIINSAHANVWSASQTFNAGLVLAFTKFITDPNGNNLIGEVTSPVLTLALGSANAGEMTFYFNGAEQAVWTATQFEFVNSFIGAPALEFETVVYTETSGLGNAIFRSANSPYNLIIQYSNALNFYYGATLNDAFNSLGQLSTYARTPTAGLGVVPTYAEKSVTAQTTTQTIVTYTPTTNGVFSIGGDTDASAYTSGTLTMTVTYTDWSGNARTVTMCSIAVLTDCQASTITIMDKASSAITIATAGTFVATYDAAAYIGQVA